MKPIGIGVIGCGGRLQMLFDLLLSGKDKKNITLTALYDPDQKRTARFQSRFNPQASVYDHYNDLVNDPAVQWVYIGSWNCFHREHAIAALKAGKQVFCEKPLATTLADCLAIRDAAQKSRCTFIIGFTLRYSPHYQKIKKVIRSGIIGTIISLEFNETLDFNHGAYIMSDWRNQTKNAGTHLLEKCCHDIDLVNWLLDSVAVSAASFGGLDFFVPANFKRIQELKRRTGDNALPYRSWQGSAGCDPFTARKDILDNQVAIIEYASGVRATFHTNCNAAIPERRMYILGTHGAIRADVITGSIEVCKIGFNEKIRKVSSRSKGGHGGGDEYLTQHLADVMLRKAKPATVIADGLKSSIVCFGIDKAQKSRRVVSLKPMWEKAGIRLR